MSTDAPLESTEGLAARCEALRASLTHRAPDLAATLAPYWPGGDENPQTVGLGPWIVCYAQCVRLLGEEHARRGRVQPEADAILLAALSATPAYVEQSDGEDALPVYPKGFRTLLHLHARSKRLAWLMERSAVLTASSDPADLPLLQRVQAEMAYQHAVCVWIATHEGPGMPFSDRESRPEPPPAMADLNPAVLQQVLSAFLEVNWLRLNALDAMQRQSAAAGEARPTWSAFFGALAIEHDEKPETLMRDYSLAALLASTTLSAQQRQQAHEEAERRAAHRTRR